MKDLRAIADRVGKCFVDNFTRHFKAARFVKMALIIGGAALAGISEAVELAQANKEFSAWAIAGLAAAVLIAIGGVYVIMTEADATETLETARIAVEAARERELELNESDAKRTRLNKEVTRGLELYNSMDVMRGGIEQSLSLDVSAGQIIQTCLSAASNSLMVAFNFDIEDTWTMCVYMAQRIEESDKHELKLIAQARKIPCNMSEARSWPEGFGVAGVAFSMGNEILIPDMSKPDLVTVFNLNTHGRSHDTGRYRSIAAVPIRVGSETVPWGVAVATSDRVGHFSSRKAFGVSTSEPVRAIAAMAALAVKAVQVRAAGVAAPRTQKT